MSGPGSRRRPRGSSLTNGGQGARATLRPTTDGLTGGGGGDVIVCKNCGTQNEAGAQFCGSCGTFLEWSGQPAPDETPTQPQPVPIVDPGPQPAGPSPDPGPSTPAAIPGAVICRACGTPNEPDRAYSRS